MKGRSLARGEVRNGALVVDVSRIAADAVPCIGWESLSPLRRVCRLLAQKRRYERHERRVPQH